MGGRLSYLPTTTLPAAAVSAPASAPTLTNQLTNTTISNALTPTGGITAGLASGSFTYTWRCRYVTRYGTTAPGPTLSAAITAGTHIARLKSIPVAADSNVIGVLLERNKQADPTGWYPVDIGTGYTLINGAVQFDDHVPDALLGAALAQGAADTTGLASLRLLGKAFGPAPTAQVAVTGDATVALPLHPAGFWSAQIVKSDGSTLAVKIPFYWGSF